MSALNSSPALRARLVDSSAELASMNSTTLPDGATVYDNETDTLYRLDKTAGVEFDSLLASGIVVKPDDGTAARWIADTVSGSSPYVHSSVINAAVAVTMTSNQWNELGSTSGSFSETGGSSAIFSISATTGLITYHGPTREVLVTMQASINNGIGATPITMHVAVSLNGDVVDGSTTAYREKGEVIEVIINTESLVTAQRLLQLSDGDTLQMMFRNETNGDDIAVNYYQCTVAPA